MNEFIISRYAISEVIKEVLQAKGKWNQMEMKSSASNEEHQGVGSGQRRKRA